MSVSFFFPWKAEKRFFADFSSLLFFWIFWMLWSFWRCRCHKPLVMRRWWHGWAGASSTSRSDRWITTRGWRWKYSAKVPWTHGPPSRTTILRSHGCGISCGRCGVTGCFATSIWTLTRRWNGNGNCGESRDERKRTHRTDRSAGNFFSHLFPVLLFDFLVCCAFICEQ